ncbi:MAG: phenylalanine--tRNA ligase subunit beta [Chthoniobacterales bacterium]|nr:MAG: phenylalanine--tRNA ligase subunit beta [Chthoniobacterales bacterium]
MKFSVNWLREFIELPSSVEELAELLTLAGIEIEGIEKRGANFDKVVVAQIIASSQHPNADRLSVCQVDDGSGQPRQIVCGAKNYKVGDKVPLALPGAVLVKDLKIKPSKLRGVESQGMLCSPSELGLSTESDGLLILSPDAKIGEPIASLFPDDTILDVEITPNRGDLLSHFGLAREIAALDAKHLVAASVSEADRLPPVTAAATIAISAPSECPFYSARRIENVTVGPSPDWLRAKLDAVGIRAINNIVDIANFVMLEIGQPMHAFDADKVKSRINVRLAKENEEFLALDGKTYSLGADNLVIADDSTVIGIAGVMGGEDSGVTETTRNVVLESAYFRPGSVRRTARKLNLPTDASYRFERGVDPGMILRASQRATELIQELAAGKPATEIATAGELPIPPKDVSLRYERCNRLIGLPIPKERVDQILEGFGLKKTRTSEDETSWSIPSFRSDLQREADLIEEVVRVFGIERMPVSDRSRFTPSSVADRLHDLEAELRLKLSARGLNEARTSKLIPRTSPAFNENAIQLRNPLNEDHVALRPSLIGGLLGALERNIRAGAESIAFFELGRVFIPPDGREERRLAFVFWGSTKSAVNWKTEKMKFDFFDVKGAIESTTNRTLSFDRSQHPNLALAVLIHNEDDEIGIAGQLSASIASKIGATSGVFVAEVVPDFPLGPIRSGLTFREFGKFPAIKRDISLIAAETLTHERIIKEMWVAAADSPLTTIQFFDLFRGTAENSLGAGKKSLAYTLTYRDKTRTLTNDEITVVHAKIRERLQRELGVELRE